jgi:hypothetical protein
MAPTVEDSCPVVRQAFFILQRFLWFLYKDSTIAHDSFVKQKRCKTAQQMNGKDV